MTFLFKKRDGVWQYNRRLFTKEMAFQVHVELVRHSYPTNIIIIIIIIIILLLLLLLLFST
jgi:hypothetical protein